MHGVAGSRSEELSRRYRHELARGLGASVLLHLLLFLLFRGGTPPSPFAAAGPRAGDDRAAPGGGLEAVTIRIPTSEVQPEPVPVPEPVPEVEIREPDVKPVNLADLQGLLGQEKGPDQGPGLEGGEGKGDGGTAMEGRFRVIPPSPRGMILPPGDRPGGVRGKEIAVWVFVTEAGRVVGDSTRLRPPTGDRGFDAKLKHQAAEWVFEPARRGGRPVAEWFQYVVSL